MEPKQSKPRGGVAYPFPGRLHKLLQASEVDPHLARIISWNEDGTTFRVHDKNTFEREIQSTYFAQTKYASFRRQLNLWSFQHGYLTVKDVEGYYAHPLFKRDEANLCDEMNRSGAPPSKTKRTSLSSGAKKKEENAEEMKQMKAKEMYLRARLAELDRQEEEGPRIRQEMIASKELQQRQEVRKASLISNNNLLSSRGNHLFLSNLQQDNKNKQKESRDASVVSIESLNQTPNTIRSTSSVTRQGENYSRRPSCNISKNEADLLLELLAND